MAEAVTTWTASPGTKPVVHNFVHVYMHKEVDPFIDYEGDIRWQQACGFAWPVRMDCRLSWTMGI